MIRPIANPKSPACNSVKIRSQSRSRSYAAASAWRNEAPLTRQSPLLSSASLLDEFVILHPPAFEDGTRRFDDADPPLEALFVMPRFSDRAPTRPLDKAAIATARSCLNRARRGLSSANKNYYNAAMAVNTASRCIDSARHQAFFAYTAMHLSSRFEALKLKAYASVSAALDSISLVCFRYAKHPEHAFRSFVDPHVVR